MVLQDTHSTTRLSLNMLRLLASVLIEKYGVDPVVESEAKSRLAVSKRLIEIHIQLFVNLIWAS